MATTALFPRKRVLQALDYTKQASRSSWSHDDGRRIIFDAWTNRFAPDGRYPMSTSEHYLRQHDNSRRGLTTWLAHLDLVLSGQREAILINPVAKEPGQDQGRTGAKGWLPRYMKGNVKTGNDGVWFIPTEVIDLRELGAPTRPVDKGSTARLPSTELRKVSAKDLWLAREELLAARNYAPFDDSDEYDVLLENGQRLPPKALLGKALSKTLGYQVLPKHFTGGENSTCFSILRAHGYQIIAKGEITTEPPRPPEDQEWPEGDKRGRWHLASERKSGLAEAKRQDFRAKHGKLYCEKCRLDPVETYGQEYGDACIEVHHARIAVAKMQPGHVTKIDDLQCLCANCHRIEHKMMRAAASGRDLA